MAQLIIKIQKEDINTSNIGCNFQLTTKEGIMIIFDKLAIEELIEDYNNLKNSSI